MERFSLHWQSVASSGNDVFRPLVVLCPWVWAGSLYVDKYVRLCQDSLGWDVLVVKWPMAAMWFPIWGRSMARLVISALAEDLQQHGERPVVFYAFSGSAKVRHTAVLRTAAAVQHRSSFSHLGRSCGSLSEAAASTVAMPAAFQTLKAAAASMAAMTAAFQADAVA